MRKYLYLILSLLFGTFSLLQAQAIREGDRFYDGSTLYTVREVRMGTVIYMADASGEEELTLEQWGSSPGVYRLRPSRNADDPKYGAEFGCRVNYVSHPDNKYLEVIGDNDQVLKVLPLVRPMDDLRLTPAAAGTDLFDVSDGPHGAVNKFDDAAYARRLRQDGLDVICFYDKRNRLTDVMQATQTWDSQELNVKQWMALLCGKYKTEGGTDAVLGETRFEYKGKVIPVKPVTFNGMVTGVIDFGDAGPFVGMLEAVPTQEGLLLTEVKMEDGAPWFERTVSSFSLKWAGDQSRFGFTRDILLIGVLHRYDKPLLRVMRNAILAAHGYTFQSKDLKSYFEAQPWYHPAANNASVKLSLLEQLNVSLIQAAERAE